jgi:hypothetical protein
VEWSGKKRDWPTGLSQPSSDSRYLLGVIIISQLWTELRWPTERGRNKKEKCRAARGKVRHSCQSPENDEKLNTV